MNFSMNSFGGWKTDNFSFFKLNWAPSVSQSSASASQSFAATAADYGLNTFFKSVSQSGQQTREEFMLFKKYNAAPQKPSSYYFSTKPRKNSSYQGFYLTNPDFLRFYQKEKKVLRPKFIQ